jgi:hypothetical protein
LILISVTSHIKPHFNEGTHKKILDIVENPAKLYQLPVDKFTDLFVKR